MALLFVFKWKKCLHSAKLLLINHKHGGIENIVKMSKSLIELIILAVEKSYSQKTFLSNNVYFHNFPTIKFSSRRWFPKRHTKINVEYTINIIITSTYIISYHQLFGMLFKWYHINARYKVKIGTGTKNVPQILDEF